MVTHYPLCETFRLQIVRLNAQDDLQLSKRFNSRHSLVAVCARDVHQHCVHACAGGAEVVHGVDVAYVEALFGRGIHALQGLAKDFRVRLLVSNYAGIGDGAKATGDAAPVQHVFDSAIRIGDDSDTVPLADFMQLFGGAGANTVPVAGIADAGDELVADCVIFKSDLGEQLGIEHPPKTVVGVAVLGHHPVELILGSAFEIAQVLTIGHEAAFGERRVNAVAIGEQQRVSNVEEDDFDFRVHESLHGTPFFECRRYLFRSRAPAGRWFHLPTAFRE
jgi:hypothetical protein